MSYKISRASADVRHHRRTNSAWTAASSPYTLSWEEYQRSICDEEESFTAQKESASTTSKYRSPLGNSSKAQFPFRKQIK